MVTERACGCLACWLVFVSCYGRAYILGVLTSNVWYLLVRKYPLTMTAYRGYLALNTVLLTPYNIPVDYGGLNGNSTENQQEICHATMAAPASRSIILWKTMPKRHGCKSPLGHASIQPRVASCGVWLLPIILSRDLPENVPE